MQELSIPAVCLVPKPGQASFSFTFEEPAAPAPQDDGFVPNPAQRSAIQHAHGPMLVLAGAGTGKTTVLTRRIARLIEKGIARPHEIRAITFTNKAAREIRERVHRLVGHEAAHSIHASTFHSFCWELLRESGFEAELISQEQQWVFLRQRIEQLPLREFLKASNPGRFLSDLRGFIDRCNDELVSAEEFAAYVERVERSECAPPRLFKSKESPTTEQVIGRLREIRDVYAVVARLFAESSLLPLGAIIPRGLELLRTNEALLAQERGRARFLLIDEFQDSNHAQLELARLLGGEEQNVFAVGDPDQAIFRFRGASSAAFEEFVACFPKLRPESVVNLAENQRSLPAVLKAAFTTISQNPPVQTADAALNARLARQPLESARVTREPMAHHPVRLLTYTDYDHEASAIAEHIEGLRSAGEPLNDIAVLYRSHNAVKKLIPELIARNIPFAMRNTDLFDTEVLRDTLAALRCVVWPQDDISWFRLALMPKWQIDPSALHNALQGAQRGTHLLELLPQVPGSAALLSAVEGLRKKVLQHDQNALAAVNAALAFVGADPECTEAERFRDFARAAAQQRFPAAKRLPEFLDYVTLYRQAEGRLDRAVRADDLLEELALQNGDEDAVQLLTVHIAKGLEWKHVLVMRVAKRSFPTDFKEPLFEFPKDLRRFAQEIAEEKVLHEQEERRLFYVAVTRARDHLALYGKQAKNGLPAQYLEELTPAPKETHVRVDQAPPATFSIAASTEQSWVDAAGKPNSPPKELSASAIEQYLRCPMQYRLSRDWRLPEKAGAALQYGSAIHSTLKDYFDALRQGRRRSRTESMELFRAEFDKAVIEEDLQRRLFLAQGIQQIAAFVALQEQRPDPQVVETEKAFVIEVAGVRIHGKIDRIDQTPAGFEVVDYKTGKPKDDDDAKGSYQLRIYAMALEQIYGKLPRRLVLYNLDDNSEAQTTATPEKQRNCVEKITKVATSIAAGRFEADPEPFKCGNCGYRSVCPALAEIKPSRARSAAGVE